MFHMMEHEKRDRVALERWLLRTPIFVTMAARSAASLAPAAWAAELIDGLIDDGLLAAHEGVLRRGADPSR